MEMGKVPSSGSLVLDVEASECLWCSERRRHRHVVKILSTIPLQTVREDD